MAAETAPAGSRRWLFGPVPDLLLGCGVGYGIVFLLQLADPAQLQRWVPLAAAPLVILVSGTPHYGATLLRVYEKGEDRRRYAFFTVWLTALIAAAFVAGLWSAWIGSLLLTLYLTWSPWHYSGQNYGISMMFLRRRGVEVTPRAKSFFHASFFLSFVLTFLALHGGGSAVGYAPLAEGGDGIRFLPLGIPVELTSAALVAVGIAYLVTLVVPFASFLRRGSPADVAPTAVLVATQALWFSVPVVVRHWSVWPDAMPFAGQHAAYAFLWVAAGHSVQYLWVTTYYATGKSGAGVRGGYLARCLLAGAAIWNVPLLLFGPAVLGLSATDAGLTALVASAVNLHHFVLDGAIWKLRDGRVAQILIRPPADRDAGGALPEPVKPGGGWLRPAVWVVGIVCVAFVLARTYEKEVGFREALQRGDVSRAEVAADRLSLLGLGTPRMHLVLARAATQYGAPELAARQLRESLALRPTPETWIELGLLHERRRRFEPAAAAYASALELAPDHVGALHRFGVAMLGLDRQEEAEAALERAAALAPDEKLIAMNLARARRRNASAPGPGGVAEAAAPEADPAGD